MSRMRRRLIRTWALTVAAWLFVLAVSFPLIWMLASSFNWSVTAMFSTTVIRVCPSGDVNVSGGESPHPPRTHSPAAIHNPPMRLLKRLTITYLTDDEW